MARALLIKNNWERKSVVEVMKDEEYVQNTFKFDPNDISDLIAKEEKTFECLVCYDECETDKKETIGECGCFACSECVEDYCKQMLALGFDVIYTTCVSCKLTMPERVFEKYLSAEDYKRYQKFLIKSFVELCP